MRKNKPKKRISKEDIENSNKERANILFRASIKKRFK
jgi:hypothetical protein